MLRGASLPRPETSSDHDDDQLPVPIAGVRRAAGGKIQTGRFNRSAMQPMRSSRVGTYRLRRDEKCFNESPHESNIIKAATRQPVKATRKPESIATPRSASIPKASPNVVGPKRSAVVLSNTQVSDVAVLAKLTKLTDLDLCNTPVSEKSLQELQQALPNCSIRAK